MALFGRRGAATPRLSPALDDAELGAVLKRLVDRAAPHTYQLAIAQLERLLRSTDGDWDRQTQRLSMLAAAVPAGLPYAWCERSPRDPDALCLLAWSAVARGRQSGGLQAAGQAIQAVRTAADLYPMDPSPWVAWLALLRLLRRPQSEVFALWGQLVARDRWNREAHLQMLGYLSPTECGTRQQTLEFVDSVRHAAPPAGPTAGLHLAFLVDLFHAALARGGTDALSSSHMWEGREAETALTEAARDWPREGYLTHAAAVADLNLLAYALVRARRPGHAVDVFRAAGCLVTAYPWSWDGSDPVAAYTHAQSQADGRTR